MSAAGLQHKTNPADTPLYQREKKVYPREVTGKYARLRNLAVLALLGLFYGVVWLKWDGRQAVLFDLPARKFYVFGWTFWPQDFIYLALLLIIAGFTLFFFTALAGRLWCGYACPQTVWTEAFLYMEKWLEGDRNKRMKLDASPWNWNKFWRKSVKHGLWVTFALWTGYTFVGYFTPVRVLNSHLLQFAAHPWANFWVFFYAFATYGNAGFLREQVCKYMCPYARFQSAMFDKDTLIISYDESRGEPRGKRKRSADPSELGLGDCIDCTMCVQVCPTGIDIRQGLQMECIACAGCIDVCNQVMDKMDYPRGLIRYTTANAMEGKPTRVMRPRVLLYGMVLLALVVGLAASIQNRTPLRMEVLRDRNALYRERATGVIENVYTIRAINMTDRDQTYTLRLDTESQLAVDTTEILISAGEAIAKPVIVRGPADSGSGVVPISFSLSDQDDKTVQVTRTSNFFYPMDESS